jgi:hypothetical protein
MGEIYYSLWLNMNVRCVCVAIVVCLLPRAGFASEAAAPEAPAPAAPTESRSESAPGVTTPREAPKGSRALRIVGWVTFSLGAEAAVVASVTSVMLLHQKGVRDNECNPQKLCSARGLDANGTIASLVGWNTASWVVAVAGLGTGAYLLLTNRRSRSTVAVAPGPGEVGVGLRGAF